MLRNFLFNLTGTLGPLVVALACIPIYLQYIGVAGYGIVGIYNSIAMLAGVFDMAFSNTINRELAGRSRLAGDRSDDTGAVFRTLELLAWGVAAALAVALTVAAPYLAEGWIGAGKYESHDIVASMQLMGFLLLLQAPLSFYSGCLFGLHRHGLLSLINVSGTILSAALAIAALAFISPRVEVFLSAQFVGRSVVLAALATASYWLLRREATHRKFEVSLAAFRRLWRFALGMNGVGFLTLLGNQVDMLVLTRVLSANGLGYYTVARTISQSFFALALPAYQSAFPQLTRMVANSDIDGAIRTFHRYCQLLAIVIVPVGVVTIVHSEELLLLWTRDPALASGASVTLSLLVAGSVLSGLACMMSAVQMAYGALRIVMFLGLCFVSMIFPVLVFLSQQYGESGAALAWLLVNTVNILLSAVITLTRLFNSGFARWLLRDTLLPILGAAIPVVVVAFAVHGSPGSPQAVLSLSLSAVLSVAFTAAVLPAVRVRIFERAAKAWKLVADRSLK